MKKYWKIKMMIKNSKFQGIIKKVREKFQKNPEFFILGFYAFLFIFLVNKIPINTDEYLYSAVGKSFASSFRGEACFNCIDPYHTFLLPLLISIFNFTTGIDSIIAYRLIAAIFSIGSIFILYKLFNEIFNKKNLNISSLLLLLLFPGFFYYGGTALLDNLAFFFFALLVYFIVKKRSYWKISVPLALLFLSKEYYIIFGGFIVCISILYDVFIVNREKGAFWKLKFFLQNFVISFLFTVVVFFSIDLFLIFPYPNLMGTFMLELFGGVYSNIGIYLKHVVYGIGSDIAPSAHMNTFNSIATRNFEIATRNFNAGIVKYFESIFNEVYVNLYVVPLFIYGIFVKFSSKEVKDSRNKVIMLSIFLIFSLFVARTATTGEHGFRIAFVFIIPFVYFIALAINNLLESGKSKVGCYFLYIFSFIYILFWLVRIQKLNSGSMLYNSELSQIFLRYKLIFNIIFYAFPATIIFLKLKISTKKAILVSWLIAAFFYKIGPEILNSYLVNRKSNIEYNLTSARKFLSDIEKEEPRIITNYERAYYYYSDSAKMPNNIRKNLPIIRPKPRVIYETRISENSLKEVDKNLLCGQNIDYIFYVNRGLRGNGIEQKIKDNVPIESGKEFFEKGQFNWGVYKFDKASCD